jgi:D-inositol-3-phosphate glycosyltransferase
MHTSPLAQPGTGDGGGMNVYVRELGASLARSGVEVDIYTRAFDRDVAATVSIEPGLRVHHVPAGPLSDVAKEDLPGLVDEFADGVLGRVGEVDALHANYWLSGVAGHRIKHELDVPLVCTFHTLDRVKADADEAEQGRRSQAEAETIGCADAVLASCSVEADQIVALYDADPNRIEIVAPGVNPAFFTPGNRSQARRALGLPATGEMLLFAGRIQPLKGLGVAVAALAELHRHPEAFLVVVGGPSGPQGYEELDRVHKLIAELGLAGRVHFVPPQRHELLSSYYRAADVCVMPSRSESFGLVALEAAACGTPVVAASVGGLTTLVEDGRTGFLIDDRSPKAFAERIGMIFDEPGLAAELQARSAALGRRYTWTEAASRLRGLTTRLTERQLVQCP